MKMIKQIIQYLLAAILALAILAFILINIFSSTILSESYVISKLKEENYYEETIDSLEDIGRYKFSDLEEVLEVCPELSKEHKLFAKKIFLERQKEFSKVLKEYDQKKDEQIR